MSSRALRLPLRLLLLELNGVDRNGPADQHHRGGRDAENQLAVLRRAHVVHVLGMNVRLHAITMHARASSRQYTSARAR